LNESASASPASAGCTGPTGCAAGSMRSSGVAWFRSADGRRYAIEIGLVIVIKLALLALLCTLLINTWPRPKTPPASVVQRYYTTATPPARHD
jgi:hypothetical protein